MKPASKQPDHETQDPLEVADVREEWGDLPIHLREIFTADGGNQMPAQYRDWIDSYYRRLNDRSDD